MDIRDVKLSTRRSTTACESSGRSLHAILDIAFGNLFMKEHEDSNSCSFDGQTTGTVPNCNQTPVQTVPPSVLVLELVFECAFSKLDILRLYLWKVCFQA